MEDIKRTQIGLYHNALDAETCKGMIEWFEEKQEAHGHQVNSWKRIDTSIQPLSFGSWNNSFAEDLDKSLTRCVNQYEQSLKIGDTSCWSISQFVKDIKVAYWVNGYKFQKSSADGGFCTWHVEHSDKEDTMKRYLVWMFYLNTTESGYTEFDYQDMRVQPTQGTLVLWPAYFTHPHRAAPDLKEDKYIITGWLHHL